MIWRLALRNTRLHTGRSVLLGGIFLMGTLFSVVAGAVVDAMDVGMSEGIIESMAGHLQIYSADAREPLALYGDEFMGMPDIGSLPDFGAVARLARAQPEVESVVPLGSTVAYIAADQPLDEALEIMRRAEGDDKAAARAEVRRQVETLAKELAGARKLAAEGSDALARFEQARQAASSAFWDAMGVRPQSGSLGGSPGGSRVGMALDEGAAITYLENTIAPLQAQQQDVALWLFGTDLPAFAQAFGRFEIVRGRAPEAGERGLLLNEAIYEKHLKNRVARELAALQESIEDGQDVTERAFVRRMARLPAQHRQISGATAPGKRAALRAVLADHFEVAEATAEGRLEPLLRRLLTVDAGSVGTTRAFFDAEIAPLLRLYRPAIGEVITARSMSRAGYSRAINLPVLGTFRFRGLEKTPISQNHNLIDLASFRRLYGALDEAARAEAAALRAEAGAVDVSAQDAEAALFGGDATLETTATGAGIGKFEVRVQRRDAALDRFDPKTLEAGLALHAAVKLRPEFRDAEAIEDARASLQDALEGAGLRAQVVTWQAASGMVGQLTLVARLVLGIVALVMAIVTLVVINNAMVLATQERAKEIGTMRAIGASRGFIVRLFTAETVALGVIAGGLGALIGAGLVLALGHWGIPAIDPFTTFLFSGERLYPQLELRHLVGAIVNVVIVGALSTAWPARMGSRTSPAEGMRG